MNYSKINHSTIKFMLIILMGMIISDSYSQKVTKLFEQGKYKKAENYCSKQKNGKQKKCYMELANLYFQQGELEKAFIIYKRAGTEQENADKIALAYYNNEDFKKAVDFFSIKDNNTETGYRRLAEKLFKEKTIDWTDFDKILALFENNKFENIIQSNIDANFEKVSKSFSDKLSAFLKTHGINETKEFLDLLERAESVLGGKVLRKILVQNKEFYVKEVAKAYENNDNDKYRQNTQMVKYLDMTISKYPFE